MHHVLAVWWVDVRFNLAVSRRQAAQYWRDIFTSRARNMPMRWLQSRCLGSSSSMATKEAEVLAMAVEEGKTRELYNTLRTGEHGVSLEALAQALYFLQHAEFTLFDVKDAFRSSTGASERFLAYREFQIALSKIARARHYGNCDVLKEGEDEASESPQQRHRASDVELVGSLVSQLLASRHHHLDLLRSQIVRRSSLDMLEYYLPQLVQSFQLYGKHGCIAKNIAPSMQSAMSLDGFVDFLNAYFEYEEFFSYDDLTRMSKEVSTAFAMNAKAEFKRAAHLVVCLDNELNFAQFLELFCRVASAFHHKLLVREGAQLRRAVESCRLEFSLEVLMNHMRVTLIQNDRVPEGPQTISNEKEFSRDAAYSPRNDEEATIFGVIQDIKEALRIDGADFSTKRSMKYRMKREGSLVGQLSRRPSTNPVEAIHPNVQVSSSSAPVSHGARTKSKPTENPKVPPQVAMIREVIMPPSLPADVVQQLENALKFQNMGQCNLALSALDSCKLRYQELSASGDDDDAVNIRDVRQADVDLFFALQTASVYDSAHQDALALSKYYEAMKIARQLPPSHPGRVLVHSCMGVTLFYVGEHTLARLCHQLVLNARKAARSSKDASHAQTPAKGSNSDNFALVDKATAMNNLACCLSQEQSEEKALDNAYLLFKHAQQIYRDAFGSAHPRVGVITRNLDRVRACASRVVSDASNALARGEYMHVIPGSTFQIQAFEFVAKPAKSSTKSSKSGGKKKKKNLK